MRRHKAWRVATCCLLAALTAACGNRLSDNEIRAQNAVTAKLSPGAGGASGSDAGDTSGSDAGAADGASAGGTSSAGGGGATAAGGTAAGTGGTSGGAQSGGGGGKAPIVIGYIAWLSGFGGDTISPSRDVWQAWAKQVNARGGINGHPVQLLVADHGGDEGRALSIARDFVENKHAIALSLNPNGTAVTDYAKSKNIPVIGSILTGSTWNSNPMQFPPFGAELNTSWASANLIKRAGMTKVASMYCAESADCESGANRFAKAVKDAGLDLVSQQRYSETQPDFTAECLQMQRAGAQTVYPTGSTAAMIRMAQSCARQNFRPVWISPTMDDSVASIPEFENAIAENAAFPWFLRSGNPGVEEYAAALQKYAPNRLTKGNTFMAWAWSSAKLFEKAAQSVSDKPSSQEILNALWSMKGETLGGLIPPRTFTRNQPTPETYCTYEGRVKGGKWVAPQGMTPTCR